jgi:hypothetical protein
MTGATEEAGKAVNTLIDAMKSAPLALALLVVNAAFLGFCGWLLSAVAENAKERNASQMQLIETLVKDCAAKPKPSLLFRSGIDRARRAPSTSVIEPPTPAIEPPK